MDAAAAGLDLHRLDASKIAAFAAIAVVSVALDIGANTVLFPVAGRVLLNPLAYSYSEQLATVYAKTPLPRGLA